MFLKIKVFEHFQLTCGRVGCKEMVREYVRGSESFGLPFLGSRTHRGVPSLTFERPES